MNEGSNSMVCFEVPRIKQMGPYDYQYMEAKEQALIQQERRRLGIKEHKGSSIQMWICVLCVLIAAGAAIF